MSEAGPHPTDPLEALPVPGAQGTSLSGEDGPAARILVVDNDTRIVELVSWFLGKRGFEVQSAHSFVEAREVLAGGAPDLMLSDLDLGAESALHELPRLAGEGLLPPTLVVSGYLDQASTEQLLSIDGVLGTLPKPFDFEKLENRVLECLAQARETRGSAAADAASTHEAPSLRTAAASEPGSASPSQDGWVEIRPARRPEGSEQGADQAGGPEAPAPSGPEDDAPAAPVHVSAQLGL